MVANRAASLRPPKPGDKCFACDRDLLLCRTVDTRDDQLVYVGPCCYRKVVRTGDGGYQPPKGGPRLYLVREPS